MEKVYYTKFMSNLGEMFIASSDLGVCRLKLESERVESFFDWMKRNFVEVQENNEMNLEVIRQLSLYGKGQLKEFDLKLHLIGTPFQKLVWNGLRTIPYGEVASYKDIALLIGSPKGFRAVGMANNRNPIPIIIPCHRIIGHGGDLVGYGGGLDMKMKLLQLEGIHINEGRVATKK
ncbi:methylated-DNA-[protein]-cysteine S-methyltransferase [Anaerosolibacter carboniphilus]|uniref:Methylated-DNA--protein-cysteine methyltransferase n=1 Tax=Anaerosolibacter carboniphilus TaxID=1417629 RepID=A0A841KMI3_9FIRM|nr:methylated-DNA--[protein]-cysteine S-methyltransferase [Anaerosolibacter carboniphilus]MBB6214613.1 methylated-DNA-[protein]-cysteine S-methyltransferase [Anaerosolibacter carboniphilus]